MGLQKDLEDYLNYQDEVKYKNVQIEQKQDELPKAQHGVFTVPQVDIITKLETEIRGLEREKNDLQLKVNTLTKKLLSTLSSLNGQPVAANINGIDYHVYIERDEYSDYESGEAIYFKTI